ncbi:hypothetical protein OH76DRAFT_1204401 [Lentinus brumalis]|uniref:Uncharacterized protein n=1 Tax=Lentinus brumalis TaxID=2498619 RepID=A0A371CT19_9APHY|nr:hypothetical protein OH76DRAFT_1204401 [Polyporus brumalis]
MRQNSSDQASLATRSSLPLFASLDRDAPRLSCLLWFSNLPILSRCLQSVVIRYVDLVSRGPISLARACSSMYDIHACPGRAIAISTLFAPAASGLVYSAPLAPVSWCPSEIFRRAKYAACPSGAILVSWNHQNSLLACPRLGSDSPATHGLRPSKGCGKNHE